MLRVPSSHSISEQGNNSRNFYAGEDFKRVTTNESQFRFTWRPRGSLQPQVEAGIRYC